MSKNVSLCVKKKNLKTNKIYYGMCLECNNKRSLEYYSKNKEQCKAKSNTYYKANISRYQTKERKEKKRQSDKEYYKNNKETCRTRNRQYCHDNKEKRAQYHKDYYHGVTKHNLNEKIKINLRGRIYKAIQNPDIKSDTTIFLLGCEICDFIKYLESKFLINMNWLNYGSKWHIDHIIPCDAFDLTQESEQRKCFHYSNLQPLWATTEIAREHGDFISIGNIEKGNKIL